MLKNTIFGLLLLMASPCHALSIISFGPPGTALAGKLSQIHSLGTIYALDATFGLRHVGTTVFSNSANTLPIEGWKLEDVFARAVTQGLGPNVTVETTTADTDKFRTVEGRLFHALPDELGALVRSLPQPHKDAYLVIKAFDSDPVSNTNQSLRGLGLYYRSFLGHETYAEYAAVEMYLIDGKTGEILAARPLCITEPGNGCDRMSWRVADSSLWAESAEGINEAQISALRKDFTTLFDAGTRETLNQMGFATTPEAAPTSTTQGK